MTLDLFQNLWVLPLLGGIALALIAGPLGSLMVWKRISFFGDTLAHGLLLGVALHFLTNLPLNITLAGTSFCFAAVLAWVYQRQHIPPDSFLVLFSQGALAASILVMSWAELSSVELLTYLIGDILTLQPVDIVGMILGDVVMGAVLWKIWPSCLSLIAHEELAAIEGVPIAKIRFILFVLMGLLMALTLKMMGALLLSTFLIAPPLTARAFAKTPEQMILGAILVGIISTFLGLILSFTLDLPTGPSIVLCLLGCWGCSLGMEQLSRPS